MKKFITTIIITMIITSNFSITDSNLINTNIQTNKFVEISRDSRNPDDDKLVDPSPLSITINI